MEKRRIVIADTDIDYIFHLQYKFVLQFDDSIDLEIITSEAYFDEMFSSLQKIDVLIVSDFLYSNSLHRHSIDTIFILSEKQTINTDDIADVYYVYKYNNISEIMNYFIAKSKGALQNTEKKAETKIILVTSANGGTGKTTIALSLCAYISSNFKKVLYFDAEELQTFQYNIANRTTINSTDMIFALSQDTTDIYMGLRQFIRTEKFSYIPPFKASLLSLGLKKNIYGKIACGAKKSNDYDYILIDSDSVFDKEKTELITLADTVIILTDQSENSVLSTNQIMEEITNSSSDKYIFVCNKYEFSKENAILENNELLRYSISGHVSFIESCSSKNIVELSAHPDIKKIGYLL